VGIDQPGIAVVRSASITTSQVSTSLATRCDRDDAVTLVMIVSLGQGLIEIAGDDRADIDDRDAHNPP